MPSVKNKWVKPATDLLFAEGVLCLNSSGAAIAANDLVFVSGASGNALTVQRTDAASSIRTVPALFVAKHAIPNGRRGVVLPWRHVLNVNTNGSGVGAPVYLADGPALGGWSLTQGTFARAVGQVTSVHATTGSIFLYPQNFEAPLSLPSVWFKSAEVTGNAGAQNTAHGLGRVPELVIVTVVDNNGGVADIAEGVHTGVNVIITATAGAVYRIVAV